MGWGGVGGGGGGAASSLQLLPLKSRSGSFLNGDIRLSKKT